MHAAKRPRLARTLASWPPIQRQFILRAMAESELKSWESTLSAFVSSNQSFQVVPRLPVAKLPAPTAEQAADSEPSPATDGPAAAPLAVRAISVLDSSFNPPTAARAALARASLRRLRSAGGRGGPTALLLPLATANADKPAAPAPLAHRLAMMVRFARHLRRGLLRDAPGAAAAAPAAIDVALT